MKDIRLYGGGISRIYEAYIDEDLQTYLNEMNGGALEYKGKRAYYTAPCSFDIESTSTYIDGKKAAFMYVWQLSINDLYLIGRTWADFKTAYNAIVEKLELSSGKRLIIYIHNMTFEYQFIRTLFRWDEVFSRDERKPLKAVTVEGVEFKDSYALTNKSLEAVGADLRRPVQKAVGALDYEKIRTPDTPLTESELGYCINDIRIVTELIREKTDEDGGITRIPLTLTGYVREYTRKYCLKEHLRGRGKSKRTGYYQRIHELTLNGPDEYKMLKRAFCGGFTHSSALNTNRVIENVASYDITSSYPTIILSEKMPMSKGWRVQVKNEKMFARLLKQYACVFDIALYGVRPKRIESENYISSSKCFVKRNVTENNGRIAYADEIRLTITEVDYDIIQKVYDIDGYAVGNMMCYEKDYLPREFIECTLHFYESKTTLKGIEGQEVEYMRLKGMLNSLYGMIVTDIAKDNIVYDNEAGWHTEPVDLPDTLDKYNRSRKRFLFYPWGIYITAYARHNLFEAICELGPDYVYSDTDSVKFTHPENHRTFFEAYNRRIQSKIDRVLKGYGIDPQKSRPRDREGHEHQAGAFTDEGIYTRFKTIGAKRYIVQRANDEYKLTVAGLSKREALSYMVDTFTDPIAALSPDLSIPAGKTGKLTHTYIDGPTFGPVTDYEGNTAYVYESTSVHLEPAAYDFDISDRYIQYLNGFIDIQEANYER